MDQEYRELHGMKASMPRSRSARPAGISETVLYLIGAAGVLLSAGVTSVLGRFLSFAGADGKPRPFFNLIVAVAAYGPWLLAILAILVGAICFTSRAKGWSFPLLGIPATWLLFWLCGIAIA